MTANANRIRIFRYVLWALVIVAALGATTLYILRPAIVGGPGGGQFALVDQRGAPVTEAIFKGHPTLLFFGYTHCPDVCPTTMGEMAGWFATLGDSAKSLQAVFISIDPTRDTPQVLGDYVSFVSDRITGVTGPQAEIDKVVKDWNVTAEKVPGDGDNYTMNHTASVFLVNSKGEFTGTIAYGENTDTALEKIRRLVANS
jgi:protein SCO1/2